MSFQKKYALDDNSQLSVIVPQRTIDRLQDTCFRNNGAFAGNFMSDWKSVEDVILDDEISAQLVGIGNEYSELDIEGTYYFMLHTDKEIGWSSTEMSDRVSQEVQAEYRFQNKWNAIFVIDERVKAPKTNVVTFGVEVKLEAGAMVFIVHTMYPGDSVGSLLGNVTASTGRVFFDWNCQGV